MYFLENILKKIECKDFFYNAYNFCCCFVFFCLKDSFVYFLLKITPPPHKKKMNNISLF